MESRSTEVGSPWAKTNTVEMATASTLIQNMVSSLSERHTRHRQEIHMHLDYGNADKK